MSMRVEDGVAVFADVCGPEEAAEFADWLREGGTNVRLDGLKHLHTAILQCLMAFKPSVNVISAEPFVIETLKRIGIRQVAG